MKVQFETPSNGSKPQTLRSSRTAITISWRTACIWASEHGPGWFQNPLSDGHTRRMLRLTRGHFRYLRYADSYLDVAMRYAVKEAVTSPSALSLMYPAEVIPDYPLWFFGTLIQMLHGSLLLYVTK